MRILTDEELAVEAASRNIPVLSAKLFRQALTHKSFTGDKPLRSNERLEFLGDSILNQIIAEKLYRQYDDRNEGELAKARSLVVCKSALAAAARRLQIVPLMLLGATEESLGGRSRASLVADAFEAIIAVIYLESGLGASTDFVLRTLSPELATVDVLADWRDPKTTLQEICQSRKIGLPSYRIISQQGKPHDRTFVAEVLVDGTAAGNGSGKSKKEAEQAAAGNALQIITKSEKSVESE